MRALTLRRFCIFNLCVLLSAVAQIALLIVIVVWCFFPHPQENEEATEEHQENADERKSESWKARL